MTIRNNLKDLFVFGIEILFLNASDISTYCFDAFIKAQEGFMIRVSCVASLYGYRVLSAKLTFSLIEVVPAI